MDDLDEDDLAMRRVVGHGLSDRRLGPGAAARGRVVAFTRSAGGRRAALAGILALAVVVRVVGMDHRLLHDEGYSWLVGSGPTAGAFLHRLAAYENTPALYYLLLAPLPLNDETWVRLPALLAGVAMVPVLYTLVRPALGTGVALLSALLLAVAPYHVANSNLARAFTLAGLALLCALWAAVRIAEGRSSPWWWLLYAAGALAALYSEYDAALTLVPLVIGLLVLMGRRRWRTLALSALPVLAFVPWVHQYARSAAAMDVTKGGGRYLTVTPASIRDQIVPLFYGETGSGAGALLRTLALLALAGVLAGGLAAIRRRGRGATPLLVLLGSTALGTLVLHALAPAVGVGIFQQRYLTFLIPLGCVAVAQAVRSVPVRAAVPAVALGLTLAGVGLTVKRVHREPEPDPRSLSVAVRAYRARTVLTNSAVVAYYLRADHLILDRGLGYGRDLEDACSGCPRPIATVDDTGVGGGARPGPGPTTTVGHFVVRLVTTPAR